MKEGFPERFTIGILSVLVGILIINQLGDLIYEKELEFRLEAICLAEKNLELANQIKGIIESDYDHYQSQVDRKNREYERSMRRHANAKKATEIYLERYGFDKTGEILKNLEKAENDHQKSFTVYVDVFRYFHVLYHAKKMRVNDRYFFMVKDNIMNHEALAYEYDLLEDLRRSNKEMNEVAKELKHRKLAADKHL